MAGGSASGAQRARRWALAFSFGCSVAWLWPRAAAACSCGSDVFVVQFGANVPRNVELWLQPLLSDPSIRLIGPEGEVPTVLRQMAIANDASPDADFPILTPRSLLQPDTEYRLEPHPLEGYYEVTSPYTFRTSDRVDTEPLPPPTVAGIEWTDEGVPGLDCQSGPRFTFTLENLGGLALFHASPLDSRGGIETGKLRAISWYGWSTVVVGGDAGCAQLWSRPGPHIVRVAAMDISGNISEWTEIPGALDLSRPPPAEILAALPVQGNGPSDFAAPLFRGEGRDGGDIDAQGGCTLGAPASSKQTALSTALLAMSLWGLARRTRRACCVTPRPWP